MPPAKKAAPAAKKAAAPVKAAPAKAAAQATVTLKHLAAVLADSHDIAKKQAEAVLGD
jgi:DNA-binding protein HU-beta